MTKSFFKIGLAGLLLSTGLNLQAATFSTTDAFKHGNPGDHTLWLPGLAANNDWIADGNGIFEVTATGATFTGSVVNQANSDLTADFSFDFINAAEITLNTNDLSTGDPKKELAASAYGPGGVDTDTWRYFDLVSGSMFGTDLASGFTVDFDQRPDPTRPNISPGDDFRVQFGEGANGKNTTLGVSGWLSWTAVVGNCAICGDPDVGITSGTGRGDINIDLSPVPVPAALWLFGSALVGFIGFSRRRNIA